MRIASLLICSLALTGCAAGAFDQSGVPEDQRKIFGRADCRRHTDHPELARDYERIQTVCVARAEAAGQSAAAATDTSQYGAIAGGFAQAMAQRDVAVPTVISCMAEHGYLWRTRAEHKAMCRSRE